MRGSANRSSLVLMVAAAAAASLLLAARGVWAESPKADGTLVAVLHPLNPATGAVDASINLGTAKFTQGNGKVDVLVQVNGVSVAGSEPEASADGSGNYYPHGIHIHEGDSCGPAEKEGKTVAGGAAGGHLDPAKTGAHKGPEGDGHAGDLPNIKILSDGSGILMTSTARLTMDQLKGRTVVLHANRDNYTDTPPVGGSGARIACGVIQARK